MPTIRSCIQALSNQYIGPTGGKGWWWKPKNRVLTSELELTFLWPSKPSSDPHLDLDLSLTILLRAQRVSNYIRKVHIHRNWKNIVNHMSWPVSVPSSAGLPCLIKLEFVGECEALALAPPVVQAPPRVAMGAHHHLPAWSSQLNNDNEKWLIEIHLVPEMWQPLQATGHSEFHLLMEERQSLARCLQTH